METGVNQLGFISSYSPLADDDNGAYRAAPEYFGMMAFAQASQGRLISTHYDPGSITLTAYAVENNVTIINKDAAQNAGLIITTPRPIRRATASRLTAPSLESKEGVKLSSDQSVKVQNGECYVQVPAASAAIIVLE
jgi:hypothetical protein